MALWGGFQLFFLCDILRKKWGLEFLCLFFSTLLLPRSSLWN